MSPTIFWHEQQWPPGPIIRWQTQRRLPIVLRHCRIFAKQRQEKADGLTESGFCVGRRLEQNGMNGGPQWEPLVPAQKERDVDRTEGVVQGGKGTV
ncbi:hypothetical protein CDAR_614781 [Caerostris darwini]|uniref:Uncharacterized protein n=1 Tax=Caerostris darwini TaxID=1538125 RepID=A0AAV4U4R6_9ARAC|nr:hypothetical protein CDAR_614781 [Caerostris darwini]